MAPARRPIYELAGPLQEPFDSFKQSNGDSSRSEDQTQTQSMALNNSGVMVGSANQQQTQSQAREGTPTTTPQTTKAAGGLPRMPSGAGDMVISQGGQTLAMPNGRKDKDAKKPAAAAPVTIVPAATSAPIYTPPSGGSGSGVGGGELTPLGPAAIPGPGDGATPPAETKKKLGKGAMIGIAVGVVLLLSVSSIGAYFYMQTKKAGAPGNGNGNGGNGGGNMSRALAGLSSRG